MSEVSLEISANGESVSEVSLGVLAKDESVSEVSLEISAQDVFDCVDFNIRCL
jgi:hypothetical protein